MPLTYLREKEWNCTQCDNIEQVTKMVTEPTDKQRKFNSLLRLSEDYDIPNLSIESKPNELVVRAKLPDFERTPGCAIQAGNRIHHG